MPISLTPRPIKSLGMRSTTHLLPDLRKELTLHKSGAIQLGKCHTATHNHLPANRVKCRRNMVQLRRTLVTCCKPLCSVWPLDEVKHYIKQLVPLLVVRMLRQHTQQDWDKLLGISMARCKDGGRGRGRGRGREGGREIGGERNRGREKERERERE